MAILFSSGAPAIPKLMSTTGNGGDAPRGVVVIGSNRVSSERMKRAAEDRVNAAAAAAGVTETHFSPGLKPKKKRHTDTQSTIDSLFAPHRTEVSNLENMVGGLATSLQGSPSKRKIAKEKELSELLLYYTELVKKNKELGVSSEWEFGKIKETKEKIDQL